MGFCFDYCRMRLDRSNEKDPISMKAPWASGKAKYFFCKVLVTTTNTRTAKGVARGRRGLCFDKRLKKPVCLDLVLCIYTFISTNDR